MAAMSAAPLLTCLALLLVGCTTPPPLATSTAATPPVPPPETAPRAEPEGFVRELPPAALEDGPSRDRREFALALSRVRPGTAEAEVRALLGAPDDVRTERDPGGISAARTVAVWRYGTNGHLTFGTLGTVHLQADGRVQYVFGGGGPVASDLEEAELRRLMRLLDAVPSYNGRADPLRLIQAVNALQRHGRGRALGAIEEYLRVSSWLDDPGREGVFHVLRVLFEPPAGEGWPPMMVGAPDLAADPKLFPRHPIALVEDIPIVLVGGYVLGGQAEPPEQHVRWYRERGVLRAAPLRPPADPLGTIARAAEPGGPFAGLDERTLTAIFEQARQLVDTVYRPAADLYDMRLPYGPEPGRRFAEHAAAVAALSIAWDPARERYALPSGATLPPPARDLRPRALVDLPVAGAKSARLTLGRHGPDLLDVEVRIDVAGGARSEGFTVRLVDAKTGEVAVSLAVAPVSAPHNSTSGSVHSTRVRVGPEVRLRVELVADTDTRALGEVAP